MKFIKALAIAASITTGASIAPLSAQEVPNKASSWVQTVPSKGWNVILRLYSPLEAWFDQTWRPGEIELINFATSE